MLSCQTDFYYTRYFPGNVASKWKQTVVVGELRLLLMENEIHRWFVYVCEPSITYSFAISEEGVQLVIRVYRTVHIVLQIAGKYSEKVTWWPTVESRCSMANALEHL